MDDDTGRAGFAGTQLSNSPRGVRLDHTAVCTQHGVELHGFRATIKHYLLEHGTLGTLRKLLNAGET